jgi:hypothetical protein
MLNFFPTAISRNFQHFQPKDHYVWWDSQLQETLESPSWTILSGVQGRYPMQAIVKVQELRVPFCLDPIETSKEDTHSWLWIPERRSLTEAGMWFPCQIWSLLMWMHWEMSNQPKQLILLIDMDAWLEMLK